MKVLPIPHEDDIKLDINDVDEEDQNKIRFILNNLAP
jgi:hypothetical protein